MHRLRDETGLLALEGDVRCSGDALHFEPHRLESAFGVRAWTLPLASILKLELSQDDRLLSVTTASGTAKLRGRTVPTLHAELAWALAREVRATDPILLATEAGLVFEGGRAPVPGRFDVRADTLRWSAPGHDDVVLAPPDVEDAALSVGTSASLVLTMPGGRRLRFEGVGLRAAFATWLLARASARGEARGTLEGGAVREGPLLTRGRLVFTSKTLHFLPDPGVSGPERRAFRLPVASIETVLVEGAPRGIVLHGPEGAWPVEPEDPQAALGALRDAMLDTQPPGPALDARGLAVDPLAPEAVQRDGFAPTAALPCLAEVADGSLHRGWLAWNQYEVRFLSRSIRAAWKSSLVAREVRVGRVLQLETEGELVRLLPMGGEPSRAVFAESIGGLVPEALVGARDSQSPSSRSTTNRRRAFRTPLPHFWRSARLRVGALQLDVPATVLDLSPDGCGLSVGAAVPPGSLVEVEFRLGSGALAVPGTVMRADAPTVEGDHEHRLGIHLDRPPNGEIAGVLDHVWRLAQRRSVVE